MHRRTFLASAAALTLAPLSFAKPVVWQLTQGEWYLAPTLEEAIQCSMDLSGWSRDEVYSPACGTEPLSDAEVAKLPYFYDEFGEPCSGLEIYRELLDRGVRIQPFAAAGD